MEDLDMFEPVSGLEDLIGILENLFADDRVWLRLELHEEQGERVQEYTLAQFAATLDMCDIVQDEAGQDVALELMFREVAGAAGEPNLVTLPIDPTDVEVDLFEDRVVLYSKGFVLTMQRTEAPTA
ncbi:MAG: hypothetical protein WCC10_06885 [Tumebacillaceae bacterium]